LLAGRGFQALLEALRAGQQLKQLDKSAWKINNTQLQVRAALQQAFYGVQEHNQFSNGDGVYQAILSPDGQTIAVLSRNFIKLWSRDGKLLRTLEGHKDRIFSMTFSPDGQILASTRSLPPESDPKSGETVFRGNVKLWSRNGKLLSTLNHFASEVAFSPDGQTIASAGIKDGSIRLWSRNGRELKVLPKYSSYLRSVAFSPDGKTIAAVDSEGTVKRWNLDGQEIQSFQVVYNNKKERMTGLVFSPDGKTIAVSAYESSRLNNDIFRLWSQDGQELQTIKRAVVTRLSGENPPAAISFSPDGQTIAAGSPDGTVTLWNRERQELETIKAHQGKVNSVTFSQDGQTLVSGGEDGIVRFWSWMRQEPKTISNQGVESAISPDLKLFVTRGEEKGTIKFWSREARQLKIVKAYQNQIKHLRFSPDGQILVSIDMDGVLKLWSREGRELNTLKTHQNQLVKVSGFGFRHAVKFSPDSQLFMTESRTSNQVANAGFTRIIRVWSRSGQELQQFRLGDPEFTYRSDKQIIGQRKGVLLAGLSIHEPQALKTHSTPVSSVDFGPDGQIIVRENDGTIKWLDRNGKQLQVFSTGLRVGTIDFSPDKQIFVVSGFRTVRSDTSLKLWNRDGKELLQVKEPIGHVFSPDSQVMVASYQDGTIILWDRNTRSLKTLKVHQSAVRCATFSPDGKMFVSGDEAGTIKLWNRNGQELKTLKTTYKSSPCIQFSPDGQLFITGNQQRNEPVKLWNRKGKELKTLGIQLGGSFSPDSQMLVTAGDDGFIRLLSRDGQELQIIKASLPSSVGSLSWAGFSPDGKMLVAIDKDDAIKLWNLDFHTLMAKGCDWVRDYLQTNPNASESDRQMCGIAKQK
jgi:WD40 repeat protein